MLGGMLSRRIFLWERACLTGATHPYIYLIYFVYLESMIEGSIWQLGKVFAELKTRLSIYHRICSQRSLLCYTSLVQGQEEKNGRFSYKSLMLKLLQAKAFKVFLWAGTGRCSRATHQGRTSSARWRWSNFWKLNRWLFNRLRSCDRRK